MTRQTGMEKPVLTELPTISDRMTFIYLEHCRISREDGAVTVKDIEGIIHIPAAAITVLLLDRAPRSLTVLWSSSAIPVSA